VKDHLLFLLFTKSAAPRKVPPRGIAPSPFVGALTVSSRLVLKFILKYKVFFTKLYAPEMFESREFRFIFWGRPNSICDPDLDDPKHLWSEFNAVGSASGPRNNDFSAMFVGFLLNRLRSVRLYICFLARTNHPEWIGNVRREFIVHNIYAT